MQITGDFQKELISSPVNPYELVYLDPEIVQHTQARPGLLTAMFGGPTRDIFMDRHTFSYDEITETMQLPNGKRYEEFGRRVASDKARRFTYKTGSFGITWNVSPQDRARKLVPGGTQKMSREYWIGQKTIKAQRAWDAFHEISFAKLLTQNTNEIFGGPQPTYEYYRELVDGATTNLRTAIDMQLAAADDEHFRRGREVYDILQEETQKAGVTMGMPVALCGKNYFNDRYEIEAQRSLGRDLKMGTDLASDIAPRSDFDEKDMLFEYQYFDSQDGFRYIKYNPTFAGYDSGPLIGEEDVYFVPMGAEVMFKRIFAPAQTETFIDTGAQEKYRWTNFNDRTGTFGAEECNVLYFNPNPQLIIRGVSGN